LQIFKIFVLIMLSSVLCCAQQSLEKDRPTKKPELVERLTKDVKPEQPQVAGEFFGTPVPVGNYYFAKKVVITFSAPWRGTPKTVEELEDLVWQELLFSYEAFNRGIEVTQEDIDEEVEKMLKADKVSFKWKEDKEAYENWVKERLDEPADLFENQMEHLVKLHKLRQQIIDSIEPEVTEEEAYQKFLDEYNTLLVELVQFDDLEEAEDFYREVTRPLPRNALDELVWADLTLSFEASNRGITVEEEEVDKAIDKLLRENEAGFRRKNDEEAYREWLDEKIGLSKEAFRSRIADFSKIDKLLQKIENGEEPAIEGEEYEEFLRKSRSIANAYRKFFGNYTEPSDGVLKFDSLADAKKFYKKINRQPGPWEDKKRREPKLFKRPGFVALDFLMNLWGFKREDAYKMMKAKIGDFYRPSPIYKGYAVFKILKKRIAQPEKFRERKDYYFDRVKMIKRMEGYKEWVKEFKEKADIKVYIDKP